MLIALVACGFTPRAMNDVDSVAIPVQQSAPPVEPPAKAEPSPNNDGRAESQQAAPDSERPLTQEEQKVVDMRLVFDRLLVDAAVLRTDLENYKRGKSKTPISLSAFRSLEICLKEIADADPANTQALEMSDAMKMAQFEILQPSVEIAADASRRLYAQAMTERLQGNGVKVAVSGRANRVIRFTSPQMTREMALQLTNSANIFDQARKLEFTRIVFTNGRRSWTYDVSKGRFR